MIWLVDVKKVTIVISSVYCIIEEGTACERIVSGHDLTEGVAPGKRDTNRSFRTFRTSNTFRFYHLVEI